MSSALLHEVSLPLNRLQASWTHAGSTRGRRAQTRSQPSKPGCVWKRHGVPVRGVSRRRAETSCERARDVALCQNAPAATSSLPTCTPHPDSHHAHNGRLRASAHLEHLGGLRHHPKVQIRSRACEHVRSLRAQTNGPHASEAGVRSVTGGADLTKVGTTARTVPIRWSFSAIDFSP